MAVASADTRTRTMMYTAASSSNGALGPRLPTARTDTQTHAQTQFASQSRQITMPAPHHSVFYRPDALPAAQPTVSKH